MFPVWNFAPINDVGKLVSSISSALSYLVHKLQEESFHGIPDVT